MHHGVGKDKTIRGHADNRIFSADHAKQIIENYKVDYQQYLEDVPEFIMADDESGFYSRLGFANIDEEALVVEYKFSYTSGGGMAQRTFTVPMTEETIICFYKKHFCDALTKLSTSSFACVKMQAEELLH